MPELHLRNLTPELHDALRQRATPQGRSMPAAAIVLLRRALQPGGDRPKTQRAAIERLREIQWRHRLPAGLLRAEQLVREDRDSAR